MLGHGTWRALPRPASAPLRLRMPSTPYTSYSARDVASDSTSASADPCCLGGSMAWTAWEVTRWARLCHGRCRFRALGAACTPACPDLHCFARVQLQPASRTVCAAQLRKLLGGVRRIAHVRVHPEGGRPVRRLDLRWRCLPCNTQQPTRSPFRVSVHVKHGCDFHTTHVQFHDHCMQPDRELHTLQPRSTVSVGA